MKKHLFFILMLAFLCLSLNAQITFQKTYGSPNADAGNYVQQTSDGGYIIAGYATNFVAGAGKDVYLVKTDVNGNMQWSKTYGGTIDEQAVCVQQTTDGGYIIACNNSTIVQSNVTSNGFLIKTNSTGDTIWTKSYSTIFGSYSSFNSVRQTMDGGYIIAGECVTLYGNDNPAFLLKVDNLGNVIWCKIHSWYDGVPYSISWKIAVQSSDGNYYYVGGTTSQQTSTLMILLKTNSAGDTLWCQSYGANGCVRDIEKTSDDGYIIGGGNYIIKIDANGNTIWNHCCSNISGNISSVQQTSDGNYIAVLTGVPTGGATYIMKLDGNGGLIWCRQYQISGDGNISFNCMQQTNNGGFIIVGQNSTNNNDIYLTKTDINGESSCNEVQFLLSFTPPIINGGLNPLVSTVTPTTGFYPCYVNSPATAVTTICTNLGIKNNNLPINEIAIYPNPTKDNLSIETNLNTEQRIEILNLMGQTIYTNVINNKATINTSAFPSGVYILKLYTDKETVVRKFVKE